MTKISDKAIGGREDLFWLRFEVHVGKDAKAEGKSRVIVLKAPFSPIPVEQGAEKGEFWGSVSFLFLFSLDFKSRLDHTTHIQDGFSPLC